MTYTPAQIEQNRLAMAFCDILTDMDDAYSYTQEPGRYDVWVFYVKDKEFKRIKVALTYDECKSNVDDWTCEQSLAIITPHVTAEECQDFLMCIAQAGLSACALVQKAKDSIKPKPTSKAVAAKSKPRTKRKGAA